MDTPDSIYAEITDIQRKIIDATTTIRNDARMAAEKTAEYDRLKATFLLTLFEQESKENIKRTIEQRAALYRKEYAQQRLEMLVAKGESESNRDYVKLLTSALTAMQTRLRIVMAEWNVKD